MPTAEESWRLTEAARARRRAEHPCPDRPRVKVRLPRDPIVRHGLLAAILGLLLLLLARLIRPTNTAGG